MEERYLKTRRRAARMCADTGQCLRARITHDVNFARAAGAPVKDYLQNNLASLPSTSDMSEQIAPWQM